MFNDVAALYDRARPSYPAALFDDLFIRVPVWPTTRVLEVGCGTGQATKMLAATGAAIRAVELGADLAMMAAANLAGYSNVVVETGAFEDAVVASATIDVVFSATAFHWIDPAFGFPKAADILVPGGAVVLVTNAHVAGGTQQQIAPDVQDIHRRLAPDIGSWEFANADDVTAKALAGGDIAAVWSRVDRSFFDPPDVSALFEPPQVTTYEWTAEYDRDLYLDMLATQSTYALTAPEIRAAVLSEIGDLIDTRFQGAITKNYLAVLATTRKRQPGLGGRGQQMT